MSKKLTALIFALCFVSSAGFAQDNVSISDPISQTATNIANQFAETFASKQAKVSTVSGNRVYLNIGEKDGVTIGMEFEVVEQGQEIKDPDTGLIIGRIEEKVAEVKVTTVRPKMSIATITSKEAGKTISIGNAAFSKSKKLTIAVTNFTTPDGIENALGSAIAEMLVVKLNQVGKFQVIERSQLKKVLEEQKLGIKTLFNNQSNLQKLGKLLGADAILVGTLTDLDAAVDTNVRLISTTTGGVIASASTKIAKTADVKNKMARTLAVTGTTQTSSRGGSSSENPVINGDFSQFPIVVKEEGFTFALQRYEMSENEITFHFLITSHDEDKDLDIVLVYDNNYSKMFDNLGNEYAIPTRVQIGSASVKKKKESTRLLIRRSLSADAPVKASITFEDVSPEARTIKLLELSCGYGGYYKVKFYDINLVRK